MKKQLPVGLLVEGNSTNSVILRLPSLAEELGPVKSKTLRVGRRLANFLGAGNAVTNYEQLQETRLILIRAPDADAPRIIQELCASELEMESLSFALCETWLSTRMLEPLRAKGACTATVMAGPNPRRGWFVAEGHTNVVRQLRRLIEGGNGRVLEIEAGRKDLYFAAELLTTALPIPLFAAAQWALRDAGISGNLLQALLEDMAERMFKDFGKRSRITWGGPLAAMDSDAAERYLEVLRGRDGELARYVDEQLASARRSLRKRANRG
jgi:hypothetical protein